jgi:hypothetical protein
LPAFISCEADAHGGNLARKPQSEAELVPGAVSGLGVREWLGRAPAWSDCLRGVTGAPPGLLTPFAVNSAPVREYRGAVSGPGGCSRRS